jgi:hypothetical protein
MSHQRTLRFCLPAAALAFVLAVMLAFAPGASAYPSPAIWIGSPVNGTWGLAGNLGTLPPYHHQLYKARPANDWAVDLPRISSGDRGVYLYAAPSNGAYGTRVTARVEQIVDNSACRLGGGGDFVTIGIYYNGRRYGHATYAHLDRNPSLYVGRWIPRWGAWLGNVAWLSRAASGGSNCWTGPHVHFEMRAETDYSCWNRGYRYAGYPIRRTNFLGFISGPLARVARACP